MKMFIGYRDLCVLFLLALCVEHAKGDRHGWREWSQFTACSRSCGGGVQQRTRSCSHHQGAGRHHCQGPDTEYKSCNAQPCPRSSPPYREVQCAEYDNTPQFVDGRYQRVRWMPHFDEERPCALTCRAEGTRDEVVLTLNPTVRDGTECDTHDAYGVCVGGTCKEVGCDREFGSRVKEDKCRVCGGDGSACKTRSGAFDPQSLNVGFNDVVTIPEGATTISVSEASPNRNYIAVRSAGGRILLNGGGFQQRPHQFQAMGTAFSYLESAGRETLTAKGPINETLHLLLHSEGGRRGSRLQYEYSMPQRLVDKAAPTARFTWVHGLWTRCSKDCGSGYQLRQVSCVDRETGSMVSQGKCPRLQRPATNQTCNLQPCADSHTNGYVWVPGHWGECEALCGDGQQTQLMYCQHTQPASGQAAYVGEELCTRHLGPKPQYKRACVAKDGCPYWATSAWSECSVSCGHGVEERRVYCQQDPKNANDIPRILPDSRCQGLDSPQARRSCRLPACQDGSNSDLHEFQGKDTEVQPDCSRTPYNCCPDGVTPAQGPNNQGCSSPDRCSLKKDRGDDSQYTIKWYYDAEKAKCERFWYGGSGGNDNRFETEDDCKEACIKSSDSDDLVSIDCGTSQYRCCPDGQTAASGPNMEGCPDILVADNGRCQNSIYRCCPDGRTPARGPNFEGCDDQDSEAFDTMSCGKPKEMGPCRKFVIQWHFDTTLGSCRQFWYGGCQGNKNRFPDKAACEKACLTVQGDDVCRLPPVKGRCRAAHPRWYYDPMAKACRNFVYGGCNGNANRFRTRTECERRCGDTTLDQTAVQVTVVTPRPIHGAAACRSSQYGCCRDGETAARGPNYAGCPRSCERSIYGCCDDGVTAAQGPDQDGCEIGSGDTCDDSDYGCCPDGFTAATGPRHQGCPGVVDHTVDHGTDHGVDHNVDRGTDHGVDHNVDHGVDHTHRPHSGRDREESGGDVCHLAQERGPCTNYTIRWYYNHVNQECDRFWFGGCSGNKNNFENEEDCEHACVAKPTGVDNLGNEIFEFEILLTAKPATTAVCTLPPVKGPCRARLRRWHYDGRSRSCRTFYYGGCMGNGNNFQSRDLCEAACLAVVLTPSPTQAPTTVPTTVPTTESQATTVTMTLTGPESAARGETVTFTCTVRLPGGVPEDVMWYHNSAMASSEPGRVTIAKSVSLAERAFTSEYIIQHATQEDAGVYHCRASPSGDLRSLTLAVSQQQNNRVDGSSNDPAEVCMQASERGNCYASMQRWHYDHKTGQCQQFMYGGCQGNKNNFKSKAECEQFCSKTEVCKLSADPGNCRAYFKKFHFDGNSGQCKEFVYGGCGGNPNNFDSLEACRGKCQGDEAVEQDSRHGGQDRQDDDSVCLLAKDGGNCGGYEIVWYYDTKYQRCGRFIYTGCQGNGNRFATEQQCMSLCEGMTESGRPAPTTPRPVRPLTPRPTEPLTTTQPPIAADPCQQTKDRGPCANYTIEWYYNKAEGYCQRFYYGGCRGNANRFSSREDCEEQCLRRGRPETTTTTTPAPYTRNPFDCRYTRHGCCEDGVTAAMDALRSNCVVDNEPDVVIRQTSDGPLMLVRPGKEVTLTCELRRDRYDSVSWYKDGFLLASGRDYSVLTNGSLIIRRMTPQKSGYFACQVQQGNAIPAIQRFRVQTRVPLSIVPGPASSSVRPGENVFLHCQAYGNPEPRIVWKREGRSLNDPRYRAFPNGTLIIRQARDEDQGEYECVAENEISSSNPRRIQLYVRERVKARIQAHKGKVMEGDTIQLQCKVTGYPRPSSSWMKDGKPLESGSRVRVYGEKLVVPRATIDDSGIYTCRADNGQQQAKDTTTVQVAIPDSLESCTDSLAEKQCMLIVTGRLCGHRMFSKMCCASCTQDSSRYG